MSTSRPRRRRSSANEPFVTDPVATDPARPATDGVRPVTDTVADAVDTAAEAIEDRVVETEHRLDDRIGAARDGATRRVRRTEQQLKDKVHAARRQVDEVQRQVDELKHLSEPTPADSAEEAATQASDLREALDRDLAALQAKLPPTEVLTERAKAVGGVALAVAGVVGAAAIGLRQRGARKKVEREARAHAAAIARYLPFALDEPIDPPSQRGGSRTALLLTLVGAAAAAAVVVARTRSGGAADTLAEHLDDLR